MLYYAEINIALLLFVTKKNLYLCWSKNEKTMIPDSVICAGAVIYLLSLWALIYCFLSQKAIEKKERKELEDFKRLIQKHHEKDI